MIDIEKMKALALAANLNNWPFHGVAFQKAANPAAVLELIAEVERLRTELAAGAARQGGNTSKDGGAGSAFESAETRIGSGFDGGAELSDGAAGTVEKDAARREAWLIENHTWSVRWRLKNGKEQWQMVDDGESWGQWGDYRKVVNAAIEAHNKAGKEQG